MDPVELKTEQDESAAAVAVSSPGSSISGALSDDSSEKTSSYPFLDSAEDAFIQVVIPYTLCSYLSQVLIQLM